MIHNKSECHKYGKDWGKKCSASKKENPKEKGKEHVNYAQLTEKMKKLEEKLSQAKIGKKNATIMNQIVIQIVTRKLGTVA